MMPKRPSPITEMTFLKRLKDYESFLIRKRTTDCVRYWINNELFNKYLNEKVSSVEDEEEIKDDFLY
jgi:hypothetical protein